MLPTSYVSLAGMYFESIVFVLWYWIEAFCGLSSPERESLIISHPSLILTGGSDSSWLHVSMKVDASLLILHRMFNAKRYKTTS